LWVWLCAALCLDVLVLRTCLFRSCLRGFELGVADDNALGVVYLSGPYWIRILAEVASKVAPVEV
jgi:hypothetical protein